MNSPVVPVVAMLVPLGLFVLIGVIAWLSVRRSQANIRARAEVQKQLLDKFSSGREFADFLETRGGQQFLAQLSSPQPTGRNKLLPGVVLTTLGIGMLALSALRHNFVIGGTLILALGLGFLIFAAISHRLSRNAEDLRNKTISSSPS
ncbi:MAG: hypothetical protein HY316_01120 [Acidobacteria bacterium]|nr:hypothetical protein [Acidobacteriota bacterium]